MSLIDVDDVKSMHIEYCYESKAFRLFRPRFHIMKRALLSLDVKPVDQTDREAVTMVLPIPESLDDQRSTTPSKVPVEPSRSAKHA